MSIIPKVRVTVPVPVTLEIGLGVRASLMRLC